MPTGAGTMLRRVMAGLLALALLVVSGAPGGLATMPAAHHGHHAAEDCVQPDSPDGHSAAAPAERERQPVGDHHHGAAPGLACCLASQCLVPLGGLAEAPSPTPPFAGPSVPVAITARRVAGIDVAPALPPPRVAA
jgi:hypothetical protein